MKRITILGLLAATTATTSPILTANAAGTFHAFTLDGVPGNFAYQQGDLAVFIAIAGNLTDGFGLLGQAEAFGPDIHFNEAKFDQNGISDDVSGDDYLKLGGTVLKLDLRTTLAQLAMADIGQKEKVTLHMHTTTKFLRGLSGSADLTTFQIGHQTYGVYENPAGTLNTVLLELLPDGHYLAKDLIGTCALSEVKASIVDLTRAANTTAVPNASTIAATKTSGAGHDRQAVAAS